MCKMLRVDYSWIFPARRREIAKWESKNPSCALCAQIGVQIWHRRPNKTFLCVNRGANVDKVERKVETRVPPSPPCLNNTFIISYFSVDISGQLLLGLRISEMPSIVDGGGVAMFPKIYICMLGFIRFSDRHVTSSLKIEAEICI